MAGLAVEVLSSLRSGRRATGARPLRLAVLMPARDDAAGMTSTIGGILPELRLGKPPEVVNRMDTDCHSLARSGPRTEWEPTERS